MNTTVIGYRVFSMMRAKKMVKDDLRKKGINLHTVSARDLNTMAELYVELHPEIVRQAVADIDRLTLEGAFGKRAQKAMARAKLASNAQLAKPCLDTTISVQMSGAK